MNKKSNQIFLFILLSIFSLFIIPAAFAYPDLGGERVNDFANILSADDIALLTYKIDSIEQSTGVEIALLTVSSTEGEDRVLYANHVGENNGVGKEDLDNGIVILWSIENEKGGAIATGRGIGDVLNDAKVSRIGRNSREYFDSEQYYDGFYQILSEIDTELNDAGLTSENINSDNYSKSNSKKTIIIIIIIIVIIFLASRKQTSNSGNFRPPTYVGRSGGWSSYSGGFGGGGFSGGSFGGGGGRF